MGKGRRNKLNRATPVPQAPLEVLHQAFNFVGDHFGTQTKCVEAAAMSYGVAKHLGYDLEVRPVSVGVDDYVSGRFACLGKKFQGSLSADQLKNTQKGDIPDEENYGHVVLTLDDPAYLMDPNLRQLNPGGVHVPNVFSKVDTAQPESDAPGWEVSTNKFRVRYLLDEGARPLLENFHEFVAIEDADYRFIAKALRNGKTVEFN